MTVNLIDLKIFLGGTRFDILGFGAPPTKEDLQHNIRITFSSGRSFPMEDCNRRELL